MTKTSPWIDADLTLFEDQATKFLEKEFAPHRERWDREGIVEKEAWLKAGGAGLLCPSIPEEYGGAGGNRAHDAVLVNAFARTGLGGGFGAGVGVHSGIVAHYVLRYGTEAQKQAWLPKMVSGELIGAIAMTEPGTGSDLQGVRTTATRVDGGYLVNGQKTFISNGQNAGLVVTVVKTDPEAGARGISLVGIETEGAEGFRRGRNLEKLGMHAQDTSELFFDDVFVPDANVLGGEAGRGFFQLTDQLVWERISCALGAVAGAELAVEMTVDYVKQRKAFGKAVIDFQNTQFKLAECKTEATIARIFIDELMVRMLAGELDASTAAMAKYWTTDMQCRVIDECLQLHGGYGYMAEYPIARLYADARVTRIFAGTNEIMKLIIGRTL